MALVHTRSPEDRISSARVAIMNHTYFCIFSGVLACGKLELREDLPMPTAATNGWDIFMHPDFVGTLSDLQLRFVLLHEAMHKAFRHLFLWRRLSEQNPLLANIAMDHFVNLSIEDMDAAKSNGKPFVEMPSVGIKGDPKYRGWNVAQIYADLLHQAKKQKGKGGGKGDGDGSGLGEPMDNHLWEEAKEGDQAQQDSQAKAIDQALRQGHAISRQLQKQRAGSGAGGQGINLDNLLAPQQDWAAQLQEFVREVCRGGDESSWARPSRRFLHDGIYMPTLHSERMGDLVVGFDVSGSCYGTDVMTRFVSELQAVVESVRPDRLHVVCWDCGVRAVTVFEQGKEFSIPDLKISGGGGTDGSSLFDYIEAEKLRPQVVINFTDGEFGWDFQYTAAPTLWCMTTNHIAPWGRTLQITL
jgi:predicted metal-dependent peptidase